MAQNPWDEFPAVDQQTTPVAPEVVPLPPTPRQRRAETRADNSEARAERTERRAEQTAERTAANERIRILIELGKQGKTLDARGNIVAIPNWKPGAGGVSLTQGFTTKLSELGDNLSALQSLTDSFQPGYGGNILGGVENLAQSLASGVGTEGQRQWWSEMANIDNIIRNNLFGATLTPGEKAAYAKTTISPSMDPDEITRNLNRRVEIMQGAARRYVTSLKAGKWNQDQIDALTKEQLEWVPAEKRMQSGNALDQPYIGIDIPTAAPNTPIWETAQGSIPIPPEMQQEHAAYMLQNLGKLDPDAYAAFRADLDRRYNFGPNDQTQIEANRAHARAINEFYSGGGRTLKSIPPVEKPLSLGEQLRNNAANNPAGAFIAGAANMGGFGIPEALAPEQMQALGEAQPLPMAMGQIGGAIAGTSGLGTVGRYVSQKAAPRLLGGGTGAQFGRNLATDAAYGGIYGGTTQGDPLTGAALAGAGSAVGQGAGGLLGTTVGGIATSPAVQALRAQGVENITSGQLMGGLPRMVEDAFTGIPGIGNLTLARRLEGYKDFNQVPFREAAKAAGGTTDNIGEAGLDDLNALISGPGGAYDRAVRGVSVPIDPKFKFDLASIVPSLRNLPDDLKSSFEKAMDARVAPAVESGVLTGEGYQQAMRGLKSYRAERTRPGFEADYRDALSQVMKALRANMERQGGKPVVQGLAQADKAHRMRKVIEDAVKRARNGSRSGEVQVFAPSQLNDAATANATKFGGRRPFAELIDAGQTVLPSKVPDSGTASRIAIQSAVGTAGLGGLGTYAALGDDPQGLAGSVALLGLLAAGGTKTGQAALRKALTGRPESAKALGALIRKHKGLGGAATVPLMLEAQK